jgi:hypothetical protein
MSKAPNHNAPRELARRASGGLEVTLYWSPDDNRTSVRLVQQGTDETVEFTVAPEHALDAFYHPFIHLPTRFDDSTVGWVVAG